MANIILISYIILLFHLPKGSWNKLQNMRNPENISHVVLAPCDNNYTLHEANVR